MSYSESEEPDSEARTPNEGTLQWSDEAILDLIEAYKSNTVLWMYKHRDYFKKGKKVEAWQDIARRVGRRAGVCKTKMVSLLSSWRRERLKARGQKNYVSRWYAYEAFDFLHDRQDPRQFNNVKTEPASPGTPTPQDAAPTSPSEPHDQPFKRQKPQPPKITRKYKRQKLSKPQVPVSVSLVEGPSTLVPQNTEYSVVPGLEIPRILDSVPTVVSVSSMVDNEVNTFCAFLASKMMGYPKATRQAVQHTIYDVLVRADRGAFEKGAHYFEQEQIIS